MLSVGRVIVSLPINQCQPEFESPHGCFLSDVLMEDFLIFGEFYVQSGDLAAYFSRA